jgi:hypothetical protein
MARFNPTKIEALRFVSEPPMSHNGSYPRMIVELFHLAVGQSFFFHAAPRGELSLVTVVNTFAMRRWP